MVLEVLLEVVLEGVLEVLSLCRTLNPFSSVVTPKGLRRRNFRIFSARKKNSFLGFLAVGGHFLGVWGI